MSAVVSPMYLASFETDWDKLMPKAGRGVRTIRVSKNAYQESTVLPPGRMVKIEGIQQFIRNLAQPDADHLLAIYEIYGGSQQGGNMESMVPYLDAVEETGICPPASYLDLSDAINSVIGHNGDERQYGAMLVLSIMEVLEDVKDGDTPIVKCADILPRLINLGVDISHTSDRYWFHFPYSAASAKNSTTFIGSTPVKILYQCLESFADSVISKTRKDLDPLNGFNTLNLALSLLEGSLYALFTEGNGLTEDYLEYLTSKSWALAWETTSKEGGTDALIDFVCAIDEVILRCASAQDSLPVQLFRHDTAVQLNRCLEGTQ